MKTLKTIIPIGILLFTCLFAMGEKKQKSEEAGKKEYSYWNDCFQCFHVLVVFFVNINVILIYSKSCTTSHDSLIGFTI